jgi:hypothetical protein
MEWIRKGFKGLGVLAVGAFALAGIALSVSMFGGCRSAAFVANLAPSFTGWTHEPIATAIMKGCLAGCEPKVAIKVTRFCHDEKAAFRYYEEGMIITTLIDTHGLRINSLKLRIIPGVVSGLPSLQPDVPANMSALRYASSLDDRVNTLVRGDPYVTSGSEGVNYSSLPNEEIPASQPLTIPIRFYALTTRSDPSDPRDHPITCSRSGELTNLVYKINTEPGIEYQESPAVSTKQVSWSGLLSAEFGSPFFLDHRTTAAAQIHALAQTLTAQNNQSGWRYWPGTFPDRNVNYPTEQLDVCNKQGALCQIAK